MTYDYEKELKDAIKAGEKALDSLDLAHKEISSASTLGFIDMLGGGMMISMFKRHKMNNTQSYIDRARLNLIEFENELNDIEEKLPNIDISNLMSMGDIFFDNFIFDFMVQDEIQKIKTALEKAIYEVENVLDSLRDELDDLY